MSNKTTSSRSIVLMTAISMFINACNANESKVDASTNQEQTAQDCESSEIAVSFQNYLAGSGSEKFEDGRVTIAGLFDKCPGGTITFAVRQGFDAGQIGRLISALPDAFIDDPCASKTRLLARQDVLVSVRQKMDKSTYDRVSAFLQRLISVYSRACKESRS